VERNTTMWRYSGEGTEPLVSIDGDPIVFALLARSMHGAGEALSQACLEYGIAARFPEIEILSWDARWALRAGFADMATTAHGATRLVYDVSATTSPQRS